MRRTLFSIVLLTGALIAAPEALTAQTVPFGKNKIQYSDFEWKVLSGDHVDVYYYPEEKALARVALAYAEDSYHFLEGKFRHHPFRRIPLIIYSSHQHFEQTNVTPGFIPEGVAGFTEFLKRRIALPFNGSYSDFRHTIRHELVHSFHLSKLGEVYRLHPRGRRTGMPLWWTEGLAEFWSSEQDTDDEMYIRDLVLNGRIPTFRQFNFSRSFAAYPLGGQLHHYLAGRFGEEHIVRLYEEIWKYGSFEEAFEAVYGIPHETFEKEWHYALKRRYFPLYGDQPPLEVATRPVITEGGANFKPVVYKATTDVEPRIYFLSPRSGYTNIYRADLRGKDRDVGVVVEGQRSAEFESFHAFDSRIDISHDGIIAFVSKFQERDALFLWDIGKRKIVGRYQWKDLVGLQSPSWDPDGSRVVFQGLSSAGVGDLYIMDFDTGERTELTSDRYDDEDPDWSPDGSTIVFSSDRTPYGKDGSKNLFLYDLGPDRIRYLTYGSWQDQDPRWSHDGRRIAFSSDRGGNYALYVVEPDDGSGHRVSRFTGAAFDPAWLPGDSALVFAGYSEQNFRIYEQTLPPDPEGAGAEAIALELPDSVDRVAIREDDDPFPPADEESWKWSELHRLDEDTTDARPYSTLGSFGIDFASGDAVVAPGVASAQGIQVLASDMLGNHVAFASVTAVQTQGDFSDFIDSFSGQLLYLNLGNRINYGAGIFRFKGLFTDVSFNVFEEENYGGFFVASYPFSKFRRLEFQMVVERSDRVDREDFLFRRDRREDPRDLTRDAVLTQNFVSYVKDNTLWLPTGPIDGNRYNVTLGLITDLSRARAENYVVMADWRNYVRTSLLSALATRAYVYLSDGAIPGRAVLGGPHRLRGYPRFSLAGSRIWLVNNEWRFPLLEGITLSLPFGDIRFPGVQGAPFVDIGQSWLEGRDPEGTWGSWGMGFRWSLGFPVVLRLDVGRRFKIGERPPVFFGADEGFNDTFVDFWFGFNY